MESGTAKAQESSQLTVAVVTPPQQKPNSEVNTQKSKTEEQNMKWYQDSWKSDLLPISIFVLMFMALLLIAIVSR